MVLFIFSMRYASSVDLAVRLGVSAKFQARWRLPFEVEVGVVATQEVTANAHIAAFESWRDSADDSSLVQWISRIDIESRLRKVV